MSKTTTMRKAVISAFGDESNINIVDAQIAAPGQDEVQIAVFYAGLSGADINMRKGTYPMQRKAPLTPGYCFVGRVRTNGPGCSKFKPGDMVTTLTMYDSDAEYINFAEKYLVPVPAGVDLKQVAGLPLDWCTAYGMVIRTGKVHKGQRVFVHGLSGAVGYATMKICQMQGAKVYGTASERNHAALREQGAEPFVYTNKDWIPAIKAIGGVHVVFDPLGFESLAESYAILSCKESSLLIGYGGNLATLNGGTPRSQFPMMAKLLAQNLKVWSRKSTTFHYITRDQSTFKPELAKLLQMLKDGTITVPIRGVFDLEDIQEAHRSWGKSPGMGCMVVRVAEEK